jgi:hypothetical protein
MRLKLAVVLAIAVNICLVADAFNPANSVYVDLNGSDKNTGLKPDAPVLTMGKALTVAAKFKGAKVVHLGAGVFYVTNTLLPLTNILVTGVGQAYFETNVSSASAKMAPQSTNSTVIAVDGQSAILLGDYSSLQNLSVWQTAPGYIPIESIGQQNGMFTNVFQGRSTYQCHLKNINCYGAFIFTMIFNSTNTMVIQMDGVNVCSQYLNGNDLIFGPTTGFSPNLSHSNQLVLKNCNFSNGGSTAGFSESTVKIIAPCYFSFIGGSVQRFNGTTNANQDVIFDFQGNNITADLSPNLLVGDRWRDDVYIEPHSTNVIVNIHNLSASPTNCVNAGDPATCAIRWNGYESLLTLPH